jgi:hypothetical protein
MKFFNLYDLRNIGRRGPDTVTIVLLKAFGLFSGGSWEQPLDS